ncbi:YdcF family protein [Methylocapsa acidiphila]|uniref:YdcF family protein n=1 Tax=Methylocapsa acidiphila TaxID=133552 RepID=UPI00041FEE0F|nr:YdcF family protein [Methylocapsa acidiphila]
MFFPVSKIFWVLVEPLSSLVVLGLLGLVLWRTRFARIGRALVAGAVILLAIGLLTPFGAALLRPLEDRFAPPSPSGPAPTGIIVLGGGVSPVMTEARDQVAIMSAGTRYTAAAELARRYPEARLVFSGGSPTLGEEQTESFVVRRLWLALGVPERQMSFEAKSRNTWENALFTRDLVRPKPGETWFLITSAWHMPRSVGIFRRLGFEVTPYPVDYHTLGDGRDWLMSQTSALDRAFMFEFGLREWIGLFVYRLTGKTEALLPAPGS